MKLNNILTLTLILIISIFLFMFLVEDKKTKDEKYYNAAYQEYRVFSFKVPEELYFAGVKIPLEYYFVKERLERELYAISFAHSRTSMALKRASRFFPVFEEILKRERVPDDFKFLAMAESELLFTVSPAGAAGLWQIIPSTAKSYNLIVNDEIDERYNVEKSTIAAAQYLKELKQRFNCWILAAAAYNMGPTRLPNFINQQQETSYFNLHLFDETNRYIYRILAYKIIYTNPTQYGFFFRNKDMYYPIPYQSVNVDTNILDLAAFAKQHNINYLILRDNNQWLRKNSLNVGKDQSFQINIPTNIKYDELELSVENPHSLFNVQ